MNTEIGIQTNSQDGTSETVKAIDMLHKEIGLYRSDNETKGTPRMYTHSDLILTVDHLNPTGPVAPNTTVSGSNFATFSL